MPQLSHRPRLLIVDDEEAALNSLRDIFGIENFDVVAASSAEQALDIFRAQDFDVVLTDLRMGNLDGMDLLKAVKTFRPDVEVVIMTAFGTIETVSYTHLRAHETVIDLVCRLLLEKQKKKNTELFKMNILKI